MKTCFGGCTCRENLSETVWAPPEGGLVMKALKDYEPTVTQFHRFVCSTHRHLQSAPLISTHTLFALCCYDRSVGYNIYCCAITMRWRCSCRSVSHFGICVDTDVLPNTQLTALSSSEQREDSIKIRKTGRILWSDAVHQKLEAHQYSDRLHYVINQVMLFRHMRHCGTNVQKTWTLTSQSLLVTATPVSTPVTTMSVSTTVTQQWPYLSRWTHMWTTILVTLTLSRDWCTSHR